MPSETLSSNSAHGLPVTAELIFGCIGLCRKSSSGCSCESRRTPHKKKAIPVKYKCSESKSCLL